MRKKDNQHLANVERLQKSTWSNPWCLRCEKCWWRHSAPCHGMANPLQLCVVISISHHDSRQLLVALQSSLPLFLIIIIGHVQVLCGSLKEVEFSSISTSWWTRLEFPNMAGSGGRHTMVLLGNFFHNRLSTDIQLLQALPSPLYRIETDQAQEGLGFKTLNPKP